MCILCKFYTRGSYKIDASVGHKHYSKDRNIDLFQEVFLFHLSYDQVNLHWIFLNEKSKKSQKFISYYLLPFFWILGIFQIVDTIV